MKEKFIGRETEIKNLTNEYNKNGFSFSVIYGRRRVGKSSLINQFISDKKSIKYTAIEQNDYLNLSSFSDVVLETYPSAKSYLDTFADWGKAFDYISEQANDEKVILFIDEYPYLADKNNSISSILQKVIDNKYLNSNIMLILCGSSMSFMEEQVLGYQSPLYGRRTMQMKVLPFDFFDTIKMFPNETDYNKLLVYAVTGGIPQYMRFIRDDKSIEEGIINSFLNKNGSLFEEPSNLLKQELREPAIYNSIINAIAHGATKVNDISTRINEKNKKVNKYLDVLLKLHIVKKELSVFGGAPRKGIYILEDNMYRFWYKYIPRNINYINNDMGEELYKNIIKPDLDNFLSYIFEDISIQYMQRKLKEGKVKPMYSSIGRWWGNNPLLKQEEEIDFIAVADETYYYGECKWQNRQIDMGVINELIRKSMLFNIKNKEYYFFSKSGFKNEVEEYALNNKNIHLISYKEMFK